MHLVAPAALCTAAVTALFIPHHSGEERADTSPHASAASSRVDLTGWQYAWPTTTSTTSAPTTTEAPKVTHAVAPRASRSAPGGGPCDKPSNCPQLRACENGGSYEAGSNPRFYGAYQFADRSTWGMSPAQQDAHADEMYAARGSQPWPVCGRYLR